MSKPTLEFMGGIGGHEKLKPCPLCGSENIKFMNTLLEYFIYQYVSCNNCYLRSGRIASDKLTEEVQQKLLEHWNTRPENTDLKVEVERLRELLQMEKEVSEGLMIANREGFNVDEMAGEVLTKVINSLVKKNAELKSTSQKILKEFLDSMEYEGCDFSTRAAIKHIFAKYGITLEVDND